MAAVKFYKVTSLPASLQPDSFYYVENGTFAESYLTNTNGVAKAIGNSAMIGSLVNTAINSALSTLNRAEIVADIAARNALGATATTNILVLVTDATGDPTVSTGAAMYVFNYTAQTWTKISEYESMDLVITWSMINGRPASTPSQIDTAVQNSHTHNNKAVLDLIGSDADGLTYNGQGIGSRWTTVNW